jgi:hypothetical protein
MRKRARATGSRSSSPTRSAPTFRVWDGHLPNQPAGLRIIRYAMRGRGHSHALDGDYVMGDRLNSDFPKENGLV